MKPINPSPKWIASGKTIPTHKKCFKCKQEKPESDFNRHNFYGDGLKSNCRVCDNEYHRYRLSLPRPPQPAPGMFVCSTCKRSLPVTERKPKMQKCKECIRAYRQKYAERNRDKAYKAQKEWRRKNPLADRKHDLKYSFGMTVEEYDEKLASQGGVCVICRRPEISLSNRGNRLRYLAVDHDHATGNNRGLLCARCNTGIGSLGDDPEILRNAITYIESYQNGGKDGKP